MLFEFKIRRFLGTVGRERVQIYPGLMKLATRSPTTPTWFYDREIGKRRPRLLASWSRKEVWVGRVSQDGEDQERGTQEGHEPIAKTHPAEARHVRI